MKYFFETYGCQMNIAESAAVEQLFLARGWEKSESAQVADIVIINTCSVRETAENRIFGRLGWFAGLKAVRACEPGAKHKSLEEAAEYVKDGPKPLTVVVMGCMAERLLNSLKKDYPCVDYVVGTYAKHHFGNIISAVEENSQTEQLDDTEAYKFAPLSYEQGSFTAFVPIMHGCNNFCTYCIVPYVRGRERSRMPEDIIREIEGAVADGVVEIMLLGQNVNSYCFGEVGFPELMAMVAEISPLLRVRFATSHPKDISDRLLEVMARYDNICKAIHLPAQSGSNVMLEKMNRKYTREWYLERIAAIRRYMPECAITTDLIAGFCGETLEDHQATLSLMREVGYAGAFMFKYSERPDTFSARHFADDIADEEKTRRLNEIIALQNQLSVESNEAEIGKIRQVLVEGTSKRSDEQLCGRTSQNKMVVFDRGDYKAGDYVTVKITGCSSATLFGTEVLE